jgi:uncharacterized protein YecT (DUF1311 family)
MNEKQIEMVIATVDAGITSSKKILDFSRINYGLQCLKKKSKIKLKIIHILFFWCLVFTANAVFAKIENNDNLKNYPGISDEYKHCVDQYTGNNIQAGYCISEEVTLQNARLISVYKKLFTLLNKSQKKKLSLAQQSWINQQKRESDFQTSLYGKGDLVSNLEIGTLELINLCERANQLTKAILVVKEYK